MQSKSQRKRLFLACLLKAFPPCGCVPRLIDCDCSEDACSCEAEVDVINPYNGQRCRCEWTEEQTTEYQRRFAWLLATIDPEHYADPPPPPVPGRCISLDGRIAMLEERASAGRSLYHPDDRNDDGREGEVATRGMNGAAKRLRVGAVPDSTFKAQHAKTSKTSESMRRAVRSA